MSQKVKIETVCVAYYFPEVDTDGIPNTLFNFPVGVPVPGKGDEVLVGSQLFTVAKREHSWSEEGVYDVILHLVPA